MAPHWAAHLLHGRVPHGLVVRARVVGDRGLVELIRVVADALAARPCVSGDVKVLARDLVVLALGVTTTER